MGTVVETWEGAALAGGRYQVIARIGEGGMGLVYRARDHNLDADVVIKVPRAAMLEDPEFAARFAREVRSLVRLAYPHIVRITDVGSHEGRPYAVMQYLPGGSLRQRQPRDRDGQTLPAPPDQLGGWLLEVADALDFIHRQGFLHRDVKPDNILFDGHGKPYVSDFGVTKVLAAARGDAPGSVRTQAGMVLGTPQYMAPEMILGEPLDGRVDQYALAVTVYEMLSGRCPYQGTTPTAIFLKQVNEPLPPLHGLVPGLSEAVSRAVAQGLAKGPADRYPTCVAFARGVLQAVGLAVPSSGSLPAPARGQTAPFLQAGIDTPAAAPQAATPVVAPMERAPTPPPLAPTVWESGRQEPAAEVPAPAPAAAAPARGGKRRGLLLAAGVMLVLGALAFYLSRKGEKPLRLQIVEGSHHLLAGGELALTVYALGGPARDVTLDAADLPTGVTALPVAISRFGEEAPGPILLVLSAAPEAPEAEALTRVVARRGKQVLAESTYSITVQRVRSQGAPPP